MRRLMTWVVALVLVFGAVVAIPQTVSAAPAERECQSESYEYDPGKTPTGFFAKASDGCNTYQWTGSIGQGPGEGTVKFKTSHKTNTWEDNGLPSMAGGPANYCKARAAHEANMMWVYGFGADDGVEVTVAYRCD